MFSTSIFSLLSGHHVWKQHRTLYGKAVNLKRLLRDEYDAVLLELHVLIAPTTSYVANRNAAQDAGPAGQMGKSRGVVVNTVCLNASGHPMLTLPVGWLEVQDDKRAKLPVEMQIVDGMFQEELISRIWECLGRELLLEKNDRNGHILNRSYVSTEHTQAQLSRSDCLRFT
jgi:amidase